MAWESRAQWVYEPEPLELSIARAAAIRTADGPVVLLDHYDNCSSGGTMDTMAVLGAILDAGLRDVGCLRDLRSRRSGGDGIAAGVGAEVTLALGGKLPMPALISSDSRGLLPEG